MFTRQITSLVLTTALSALLVSGLSNCGSKGSTASETTDSTAAVASSETEKTTSAPDPTKIPAGKVADAAAILGRTQVPILCYHQIRDWKGSDSKGARDYIIPTQAFTDQMQMLADSGFHPILPDQLYAYLTTGAALPSKPVMLTFDDGDLDQYTTALPILDKHKFKASFYIMTVAIGRRGKQHYMDKAQIKDLSDRGHTVGAHTWDHQNMKKMTTPEQLKTQLEEPKEKLEAITGKPVRYFAFPFGLWNKPALPEIQKRGYVAAFTLADGRDEQYPLMTVRRIIAGGQWSAKTLYRNMTQSFDGK
ncbi:polysaccharide deacetylase family protein [Spirosoma rhododendri]|uniref:Polysaccharide deacetylase family protein n=1 Tax=Spirosoma rhododendri TaxID=2728024 RepID=A0A7L5DLU7_9BACT|nr:polysaccharide deacetylase family protein [Spirosoma rhododendri]QJD78471.1 polysaccharide deacetylase family protein [Spirosoma rhododendri]